MKRVLFIVVSALCLTCSAIFAADIPGVVKSTTKKYATVASNSNMVPIPGDKAFIYFKVPKSDVEISVASGHVYEITGPNIMIQIDKATGAVAKDQLVRITSPNPKKKEGPAAPSPAAAKSGATVQQLIGTWRGPHHTLSYAANGTMVVDPQPGKNDPPSHWRLIGDELITASPKGEIRRLKIKAVHDREIDIEDENGLPAQLKRVDNATPGPSASAAKP